MKNADRSSIVVQWDEVDDSLTTTTYTVTWTSERDRIKSSPGIVGFTSYTITGLTLDTVYTITVTATNICGTGPEYRTSVSLTADTISITSSPTTTTTTVMGPSTIITNSVTNTGNTCSARILQWINNNKE